MSKKSIILGFAAAFAAVVSAGSAFAFGITVGPGGVNVHPGYYYNYDDRHYDNWGINANDAVDIARQNGMRDVQDVQRHSHTYEVTGYGRHHRFMTVVVSRSDGRVISVDY